jgi:hypothetical protein
MQPVQRVILLSSMFVVACVQGVVPAGGGGAPDAGPSDAAPPGGPTAADLLREWSGCMTLDNFKLADMAGAWGTMAASNGQACSSCHGSGLQGFYADRDETGMFTAISTMQGFMVMYFSADVPGRKVIVNEGIFVGVAAGQGAFQGHPPFDPRNNQGMTALENFYRITLPLQQAGTCGPPKLL